MQHKQKYCYVLILLRSSIQQHETTKLPTATKTSIQTFDAFVRCTLMGNNLDISFKMEFGKGQFETAFNHEMIMLENHII